MNERDVAWLLARAATEPESLATLCGDPQAAAEALGLSLTDAEAAEILEYARGMRKRAEQGGTQVLAYPLPKLSGPPDDDDPRRRKPKP